MQDFVGRVVLPTLFLSLLACSETPTESNPRDGASITASGYYSGTFRVETIAPSNEPRPADGSYVLTNPSPLEVTIMIRTTHVQRVAQVWFPENAQPGTYPLVDFANGECESGAVCAGGWIDFERPRDGSADVTLDVITSGTATIETLTETRIRGRFDTDVDAILIAAGGVVQKATVRGTFNLPRQ